MALAVVMWGAFAWRQTSPKYESLKLSTVYADHTGVEYLRATAELARRHHRLVGYARAT